MDIIRGIAVIVLGGAGLYLSGLNWLILSGRAL